MTLPEQSNRAVAATREFLVRLASPYGEGAIKGIRREIRAEALRLLRHYPYVWLSQYGDCPVEDNVENADILTDTPATHATPSQGSVRIKCTLSDSERAAIARAVKDENEHGLVYTADVLQSLLERTK
jgi:hypothetical protein